MAWLIKTTISEQMKRHSVKLIAVAASTFMAHSFLMLLLDFGNATGMAFSGHSRLFIRGPIVRLAFTAGMVLLLFAPLALLSSGWGAEDNPCQANVVSVATICGRRQIGVRNAAWCPGRSG